MTNPSTQPPKTKKEGFQVISRAETDNAIVEVIQYPLLRGSDDIRTAEKLYYAAHAGLKLKMVRITLKNSKVKAEPGSLYYMRGNLEMSSSSGGGLLKGFARKFTSGETLFVNEIEGSGQVHLEPSFGHFFLHKIEEGSPGVICDKGMFYAGTADLEIGASAQKNISSALFGGEGLFQTSITGTGIAVLYSPVPMQEVQKIQLKDEKLSVDGNFALMRSGNLDFRVEKSSKSWLATSVSGEGLLHTFEGTGSVWIAPTQSIYDKLATSIGTSELASLPTRKETTVADNREVDKT